MDGETRSTARDWPHIHPVPFNHTTGNLPIHVYTLYLVCCHLTILTIYVMDRGTPGINPYFFSLYSVRVERMPYVHPHLL